MPLMKKGLDETSTEQFLSVVEHPEEAARILEECREAMAVDCSMSHAFRSPMDL
jgi:hypothetical protein